MTLRVSQTISVSATPAQVWEFIKDPANRAKAIRFVDDYRQVDERTYEWGVRLPVVDKMVWLKTEDVVREHPTYVKFEGEASIGSLVGEYDVTETEDGCTIKQSFVVESWMPGVEAAFESQWEDELERLGALIDAAYEE